jgi:hypothetical protein
MRAILFVALMAGALSVFSGTGASAQYYPWCSLYSDKVGSSNCGFVSFEQCMANVRGIGGFCVQNAWAAGREIRPYGRTKRRN